MDTLQIILISFSSFVIALNIILLVIFNNKKKNKKQENDYSEIINLFNKNNIINIEVIEKRVRIEVKDLTLVDLEGLKPFTNGIFTTGNKVVVTFKENTKEIIKALGENI